MNLHLELTNRCTLKCPACPRTQWQELLKKTVTKQDLDFRDLANFLDCEQGHKIQEFIVCGDYGDVIYYPQLFEFLDWFRSTKRYVLYTNGSHQTASFWNRLAESLTESDTVVFAIDGLEHTNHIYRINSDWHSVMTAVDIMSKSPASVVWKTIVFAHNFQDLKEIKKLAQDKGCSFRVEKTHRFGNDTMSPPGDLIESNHVYQEIFSYDHTIEIEPKCMQTKTVGCDGIIYPCDWLRNPRTFYKSELWRQQTRWLSKLHIKNTTLDAALTVIQDWANYVRQSSLEHSPTVDVLCKMKCRKGCDKNNRLEI